MPRAAVISTLVLVAYLNCAFACAGRAALLAEIGISIAPAFDGSPPTTDSVLYRFDVGSHSPTLVFGKWGRQVSASDVGQTFEADSQMVESFARALTRPGADVTIRVNNISYSRPLDQLQDGGWGIIDGRATFNKFAPDITKIPVNRLTMTIDSFHLERFDRNAAIGGGHTIRIYGVPEPATWVLFCVGLLHCGSRVAYTAE
jgi:hypothetical protein